MSEPILAEQDEDDSPEAKRNPRVSSSAIISFSEKPLVEVYEADLVVRLFELTDLVEVLLVVVDAIELPSCRRSNPEAVPAVVKAPDEATPLPTRQHWSAFLIPDVVGSAAPSSFEAE